jgi:hypothetical protein
MSAFDILDFPPPFPVRGVEVILQDRKEPSLKASARLEPVAPVTGLQERALHQVFRAIHVMGKRDRKGAQRAGGLQEFLDKIWIMPILGDPDGTLQASDQPDQIRRQIGGDEVGIDATQLLSQMVSDRIAKNNGVEWPERGASHEEEMLSDRCGINLQACGKLTQSPAGPLYQLAPERHHRS